jgi:hypothetical protein
MGADEKLNNLFEKQRTVELVITITDLNQMLIAGKQSKQKRGSGRRKLLLILSGGILLLAFLLKFYANSNDKPANLKKNQHISRPVETSIASCIKSNEESSKNKQQSSGLIFVHHSDEIKANKDSADKTIPGPQLNSHFSSGNSVVAENSSDYFELTFEELKRLNIFTDGNSLTYANKADTAWMDLPPNGSIFYGFNIKIEPDGTGKKRVNFFKDSVLFNNSLDIWPVAVEVYSTNNDTSILFSNFHISSEREEGVNHVFGDYFIPRESYLKLFSDNKHSLVPIRVSISSQTTTTGHDILFWFSPTDKFLERLLSGKADWVRKKYTSVLNKDVFILGIEKLKVNTADELSSIVPNAAKRKEIFNRALVLNNEELKKLGFQFDGVKTYVYKNTFKNRGRMTIYFANGDPVILTEIKGVTRGIHYMPWHKSFGPVYISDTDIYDMARLDIHNKKWDKNNMIAVSEKSAIEEFVRKIDSLIPVKVVYYQNNRVINNLFWFEPAKDFISALPGDILNKDKNKNSTSPQSLVKTLKPGLIQDDTSAMVDIKLEEASTLNIYLRNAKGEVVQNFANMKYFKKGKHRISVPFPKSGVTDYVLIFENGKGEKLSMPLIKK